MRAGGAPRPVHRYVTNALAAFSRNARSHLREEPLAGTKQGVVAAVPCSVIHSNNAQRRKSMGKISRDSRHQSARCICTLCTYNKARLSELPGRVALEAFLETVVSLVHTPSSAGADALVIAAIMPAALASRDVYSTATASSAAVAALGGGLRIHTPRYMHMCASISALRLIAVARPAAELRSLSLSVHGRLCVSHSARLQVPATLPGRAA